MKSDGRASNKSAHLRRRTGVHRESKNQNKTLLTRPASLEMTHYPPVRLDFSAPKEVKASPTVVRRSIPRTNARQRDVLLSLPAAGRDLLFALLGARFSASCVHFFTRWELQLPRKGQNDRL